MKEFRIEDVIFMYCDVFSKSDFTNVFTPLLLALKNVNISLNFEKMVFFQVVSWTLVNYVFFLQSLRY